ncbi:MAG: LysE family transporter, partial [Rhabdaerophilum sp.]
MLYPFVSGFLIGGGLIIAIGAQNAFILRQGIRREHVFPLALICSVSDALLIALGVAGLGALIQL